VPPADGTRVPKVSLQVPGLVVSKRNQPRVETRLGFAAPFMTALTLPTDVAASVEAVGAAGVVNESTAPKRVPAVLEAIAQK
jgi:hypothetical protein